MLYRKALLHIKKWKQSGARKALMLTGARQIGKTTLVREFAKTAYSHFAELNFLLDEKARTIFDGPLDADTIIANLTAYLRMPLEPGNTLILLDEIQECPRARAAIKFLVEDGRFDYIETGSLLGVRTKDVPSYPVGFEENYRMYPLDFEEFCLANGVQQETISLLQEHFEQRKAVNESIHATMNRLFFAYMVIGGMPEVVQRYVDSQDIAQVVQLQRDILELYRLDISKYAQTHQREKIRAIFDAIPSQLEDKNRRFILANLSKTARQERYQSSFLWLADAGVALPCYNVSAPTLPLETNVQRSIFKLFMNDTGLLCASALNPIQLDILQGNIDANVGSIAENVIAQELKAHGFDLRYYNNKRIGEVDFIVQSGANVLPIEVKSGNDWLRHTALDNVMDVGEWHIDHAYVLNKGNVKRDKKVTYLPLYFAMFLKPKELPPTLPFSIDLSALSA